MRSYGNDNDSSDKIASFDPDLIAIEVLIYQHKLAENRLPDISMQPIAVLSMINLKFLSVNIGTVGNFIIHAIGKVLRNV